MAAREGGGEGGDDAVEPDAPQVRMEELLDDLDTLTLGGGGVEVVSAPAVVGAFSASSEAGQAGGLAPAKPLGTASGSVTATTSTTTTTTSIGPATSPNRAKVGEQQEEEEEEFSEDDDL